MFAGRQLVISLVSLEAGSGSGRAVVMVRRARGRMRRLLRRVVGWMFDARGGASLGCWWRMFWLGCGICDMVFDRPERIERGEILYESLIVNPLF